MIELKGIDYSTSKQSVMKWHYSKRMPVGKLFHIGVFENGKFIGAVVYGLGACSSYGKRFKIKNNEICELLRVALDSHDTPTSKIVSISLKIVKKYNKGLRAVISFADTNQEHVGTIYQATNFYYIGKTKKGKKYYKDGKEIHTRYLSEKGIRNIMGKWIKCSKPSECITKADLPKHRYLYLFDKSIYKIIENEIKQYPKKCVNNVTVA